jgi:hypothetical protein
MAITRKLSPHINFHDSTLIKAVFADGLYQFQAIVYAPNDGPDWDKGRFYQLSFLDVLRLELEVSGPQAYPGPVEVYEIYLEEGEEYHRWREWLAKPDRPIYHVMLASSFARGWGKNEALGGISVVCGAYEIEDVTSQWPDEHRVDPRPIPGPQERCPSEGPRPRHPRKPQR